MLPHTGTCTCTTICIHVCTCMRTHIPDLQVHVPNCQHVGVSVVTDILGPFVFRLCPAGETAALPNLLLGCLKAGLDIDSFGQFAFVIVIEGGVGLPPSFSWAVFGKLSIDILGPCLFVSTQRGSRVPFAICSLVVLWQAWTQTFWGDTFFLALQRGAWALEMIFCTLKLAP